MATDWPVTVYLALRPETYNRSMREGALSAYHPKAFSIAPPRIDEVVIKRLQFARKMTTGKIPVPSLGTDLKINTLDTILQVFIETIEHDTGILECVDNISGGNVRRALDLVRDFFGSGHVELQRIVDSYMQGYRPRIHLHDFLRAMIYGDAKFYDPGESPVANIFDITAADAREHFLVPMLISLLERMATTDATGEVGFVHAVTLCDQLQLLGFSPQQVDSAIRRCVGCRLLEVPGRVPLALDVPLPESIRITSVSVYHIKRLPAQFVYLDAVVVDTPILDPNARQGIRNVEELDLRLKRAQRFVEYLDQSYQPLLPHRNIYDWEQYSSEAKANIASIQQRL